MPHKPTLFIDFDGTICFDRFWRSAGAEVRLFINRFLFGADETLVRRWMLGYVSSEEVNAIISQAGVFSYADLWQVFVADCLSMRVHPSTLAVIQKARRTHRVILVTDNMDAFDRFTRPQLGLDACFDAIASSHQYGALKNHEGGGLFKVVAHEEHINLHEAILIDNAADNCRIFRELGGQACQVTQPQDVESIINALIESR